MFKICKNRAGSTNTGPDGRKSFKFCQLQLQTSTMFTSTSQRHQLYKATPNFSFPPSKTIEKIAYLEFQSARGIFLDIFEKAVLGVILQLKSQFHRSCRLENSQSDNPKKCSTRRIHDRRNVHRKYSPDIKLWELLTKFSPTSPKMEKKY